jgi:hypothetical protein
MHGANCRFPKDIRVEGQRYIVNDNDVRLLVGRAGKAYYSINKSAVRYIDGVGNVGPANAHPANAPPANAPPANAPPATELIIVYDSQTTECVICMDNPKTQIFAPCGHYYCCLGCADKLNECPICRAPIIQQIDHSNME